RRGASARFVSPPASRPGSTRSCSRAASFRRRGPAARWRWRRSTSPVTGRSTRAPSSPGGGGRAPPAAAPGSCARCSRSLSGPTGITPWPAPLPARCSPSTATPTTSSRWRSRGRPAPAIRPGPSASWPGPATILIATGRGSGRRSSASGSTPSWRRRTAGRVGFMTDSHRLQPNRPDETSYAGVPLALDPAGLAGADVAILGAPFDEGVSYRPGTRFGPRAIRMAEDVAFPIDRPHMELGIDPYAELDIVDYGDVEVRSSDLARSHTLLQKGLSEILAADAIPVVLGGDHSLSMPVLAALAGRFGPEGFSVIHFDTHADTGDYEGEAPHGTPFHHAVRDGHLDGRNIVQVGLRGAWPFPEDFEWMRSVGFRWHTMGEIVERGIAAVTKDAIAHARA